jgi:multidrug resistance efflux pump
MKHAALLAVAPMMLAACTRAPAASGRVSGYVEATEVRVASEVGGRLLEVKVAEGDRVNSGDVIARVDTADVDLTIRRVTAERDQAQAQLALLRAGSRPEDIRQASSQVQSAQADVRGAQAELDAANADLERFEGLLRANAGSVKQRDDAKTRRDVAQASAPGRSGPRRRPTPSRGCAPAPGRRRSTPPVRASPRSTRRWPRCRRTRATRP